MGSIENAFIVPHGFSIIEEISGNEKNLFKPIRDSMHIIGNMISDTNPDLIVLATPHGLRLKGYNAIYCCDYCSGNLIQNNCEINLEFKCDREFSEELYKELISSDIPSVSCNFGALSGPLSKIEMDWGTFIPLWFVKDNSIPIVVICPTRDIPITEMEKIGICIKKVVNKKNKKISFIASADQGHCHDKNGPYGYNKASEIYDKKIIEIIKNNRLEELYLLDPSLIEEAKPDSYWQMMILFGLIKGMGFSSKLLRYDVPTYFGMLTAAFS